MTHSADDYELDIRQIPSALGSLGPAEVALLVQDCVQRGLLNEALALCHAIDPDRQHTVLTLGEAVAEFRLGRADRALGLLAQVRAQQPDHLLAIYYEAQIAMRMGEQARASRLLAQVLEAFPDFPGAHATLAQLHMPGLGYREVLARIHQALRPATYLEVGIESGQTLALATASELAIGVDLVNRLQVPLGDHVKLYFEESDAFFQRERAEVLGERKLHLTFIDGLHLFEQTLRDFRHAETWSTATSVIVLHDCLPLSRVSAARTRQTKFWVGDTWKALAALLAYRPDLTITALLAPPSGLVFVSKLDPASRALEDAAPEIIARYESQEYACAPGEWLEALTVLPSTEAGLSALAAVLV